MQGDIGEPAPGGPFDAIVERLRDELRRASAVIANPTLLSAWATTGPQLSGNALERVARRAGPVHAGWAQPIRPCRLRPAGEGRHASRRGIWVGDATSRRGEKAYMTVGGAASLRGLITRSDSHPALVARVGCRAVVRGTAARARPGGGTAGRARRARRRPDSDRRRQRPGADRGVPRGRRQRRGGRAAEPRARRGRADRRTRRPARVAPAARRRGQCGRGGGPFGCSCQRDRDGGRAAAHRRRGWRGGGRCRQPGRAGPFAAHQRHDKQAEDRADQAAQPGRVDRLRSRTRTRCPATT